MNAHSNNAQVDALSDRELDIVSGGERHQVTKEQYEILLSIRMAFHHNDK